MQSEGMFCKTARKHSGVIHFNVILLLKTYSGSNHIFIRNNQVLYKDINTGISIFNSTKRNIVFVLNYAGSRTRSDSKLLTKISWLIRSKSRVKRSNSPIIAYENELGEIQI
jgi:hypothetical protein